MATRRGRLWLLLLLPRSGPGRRRGARAPLSISVADDHAEKPWLPAAAAIPACCCRAGRKGNQLMGAKKQAFHGDELNDAVMYDRISLLPPSRLRHRLKLDARGWTVSFFKTQWHKSSKKQTNKNRSIVRSHLTRVNYFCGTFVSFFKTCTAFRSIDSPPAIPTRTLIRLPACLHACYRALSALSTKASSGTRPAPSACAADTAAKDTCDRRGEVIILLLSRPEAPQQRSEHTHTSH